MKMINVDNGYIENGNSIPYNSIERDYAELVQMVGEAIEAWAHKYNMENLPKKILLQHVLIYLKKFVESIESI